MSHSNIHERRVTPDRRQRECGLRPGEHEQRGMPDRRFPVVEYLDFDEHIVFLPRGAEEGAVQIETVQQGCSEYA